MFVVIVLGILNQFKDESSFAFVKICCKAKRNISIMEKENEDIHDRTFVWYDLAVFLNSQLLPEHLVATTGAHFQEASHFDLQSSSPAPEPP